MDFLALGLLLLGCAIVVGILSGDWRAWVREEWRRIKSYSFFMDEQPTDSLTSKDPAVQSTLARLADARERMRIERIQTIYEGRPGYTPVKPMAKGRVQRPARVIQIRRKT